MEKYDEFEEYRYEKAKRKAKEIRGFYYNLVCYCIVIPVLIFINLTFVPHFHWFWFSLIGWGTGILVHGVSAFELNPFLGKNWEEKKLQQLIEEEKRKQARKNNN
ncbi:2TM domain-containing protein [Flavobacterium soli]|uniref:2TM domain-containing protein n=1 Tax=Flavobacterium soli TaxID=344881 RepID=UPI0003F5DB3F|nr:2TM domain-containing protein [Flavobacterium soli]